MCDGTSKEVADKLAILEALARYGYHADRKDADGFAGVFTEDGVLGDTASRAAIRERQVQRFAASTAQTRHFPTTTVFLDLTAETARTHTTMLFAVRAPGAPAPVLGTGTYLHEWRRTAEGWQIARQTTTVDS